MHINATIYAIKMFLSNAVTSIAYIKSGFESKSGFGQLVQTRETLQANNKSHINTV